MYGLLFANVVAKYKHHSFYFNNVLLHIIEIMLVHITEVLLTQNEDELIQCI